MGRKRDLVAPLALLALAGPGAGCGDSEEDSPPPAPPSTPVQPAANRAIVPPGGGAPGTPGAKGPLTTYIHVEDLLDPSERSTIRHQFRESDFAQDPNGDNRDPFRSSYMLDIGLPSSGGNLPTDATEQCTAKQMVATSYSVRDLRLVGIVSRGLKRYALMQDSANFGQIVTRGDCLGKEKARVKEIGAGYMTLEVLPEGGIAGTPQVAQERSIPLYPEELPMSRANDGDSGGGGTSITPVLPPSSQPPVVMPPSGGGGGGGGGGSGAVAPTGKAPGSAPAAPPVVMPPPEKKSPDKK